MCRRKDVDDPATDAKLAPVFDETDGAIAPGDELRRELITVDGVSLHQVQEALGELLGRRNTL